MEPVSLSFDYRLEDWRALQVAARRRAPRLGSGLQRRLTRLPGILLLAAMVLGATFIPDSRIVIAAIAGVVATLTVIALQSALVMRHFRPLPNGMFLGPARIIVDSEGLHYSRDGLDARVHWQRVLGVEATATNVFVWVDAAQGYNVPARALPAPMTAADLVERIRVFMAAAGPMATPPPEYDDGVRASPTVANEVSAIPGMRPGVWRELAAIVRLLLVRRVDGASIVGRDITVLVLGVILLAIWIPLDLLVFPGEMQFNWYAVESLAWVIAGVLGLAWILSRLSRPPVPYRRVLLLAIGSLVLAIIASTVAALVDDSYGYIILAVTLVWGLMYFGRGMRALTGEYQSRATWVAVAATFCFVIAGDYLYVNPSFWQYAEDEEQTGSDTPDADPGVWARMEELQFEQQGRLDEELARIEALPRVKAASYFVGFAGYGEQRVFADEINLAKQRVGALYGSEQRSILLVNDQRDPEKLPLASAPALRYTLARLGSMMHADDVLFLALSSHGSEDGSISVSNAGRTPVDLSAGALADMLREAKIPWKVIVVSACYAGGFIDALRDDHTIVIAAAAQDRESFGCADDRDLTYFGEAFYRDALPKAANLRAAFERARAAIGRREKEEHFEASDPQAYFSAALEAKLASTYGSSVAPIR